jgi:hypothetical protein
VIENIARRRHSPVELVRDIGRLAKTYKAADIAAQSGVKQDFNAAALVRTYRRETDRQQVIVVAGTVRSFRATRSSAVILERLRPGISPNARRQPGPGER